MVQGRRVYTVEGLRLAGGALHPVQDAMVRELGSQCGYCTPGVVMSLFEACYRRDLRESWQLDDQLCGNLCRCTGYRPIRDAARSVAATCPQDRFSEQLERPGESIAFTRESAGRIYATPTDFAALWAHLAAHPQARLICGGTDLSLLITKRFIDLPELVSLEGLRELRGVTKLERGWRIGATTNLAELEAACLAEMAAYTPLLRMLRYFASRQIKNRATIGGNLCNASPIGDLAPVLISLGATAVLRSASGTRRVPLAEFFLAYRQTALQPGEILAAVELPDLPANARIAAYKVSKRRELDISTVAAGCYVELDPAGRVSEIRIAYGGMAATPARARNLEAALLGRSWSLAQVEAALPALAQDFRPIDDLRGSAWYRGTVAQNLVRGFVLETQSEARFRTCPKDPLAPCTWRSCHDAASTVSPRERPRSRLGRRALRRRPAAPVRLVGRPPRRLTDRLWAAAFGRPRRRAGAARHPRGPARRRHPRPQSHRADRPRRAAAGRRPPQRRRPARRARRRRVARGLSRGRGCARDRRGDRPGDPLDRRRDRGRLVPRHPAPHAPRRRRGRPRPRRAAPRRRARQRRPGPLLPRDPGRPGDPRRGRQPRDPFSSTQHPTEVQTATAEILGCDRSRIVVQVPRMGGGFGGKESQATHFAALAALAARHLQRPVKVWLNRDQDMTMTGKRHPFWSRYRAGFDRRRPHHRARGLHLRRRRLERRPHPGDPRPRPVPHRQRLLRPQPALRGPGRAHQYASNTAFRGFGGPQGMLVIEDAMARAPSASASTRPSFVVETTTAVRRSTAPTSLPEGQVEEPLSHQLHARALTPYYQTVDDCRLPRIHPSCCESADYAARRAEIDAFNARSPLVKRGLGFMPVKFGISFTNSMLNQAGALVLVYTDGSVQLNHGGTEMGQGLHSKMLAICAHELGVRESQIRVMPTATDKVPNTSATAASSGSDLNGAAVQLACAELRERLRPLAAELSAPATPRARPLRRGPRVRTRRPRDQLRRADPRRLGEAYRLSATGYYATPGIVYDRELGRGKPFHYFAYGAALTEVEVSGLTGEHRVLRVDILHDVGHSLLPSIDRGQIEGGYVQGLGWLTCEELVWDGRAASCSPTAPPPTRSPPSATPPRTSASPCSPAPPRTPSSTAARPSASRPSCWRSR
jgi:xanthine dehydrogenase small subunit